jgi:hypothetical protein
MHNLIWALAALMTFGSARAADIVHDTEFYLLEARNAGK